MLERGLELERVETGNHAEVAFAHEKEEPANSEGHGEGLRVQGFIINVKKVIDGKELEAEQSSD